MIFFSDGFFISSRLSQTSFTFIVGNMDQKMNPKFSSLNCKNRFHSSFIAPVLQCPKEYYMFASNRKRREGNKMCNVYCHCSSTMLIITVGASELLLVCFLLSRTVKA